MLTEIVALISVLIAVVALLLTLWQNILSRRALQAQVYLTLRELQIEANCNDGIAAITALKNYDNYDLFVSSESQETQSLIVETVTFLNYAAHLVEEKFIPRQTIWNLYFWAYRVGNEKLLTWWLDEQRKNKPQEFSAFERMCRQIGSISAEAIAEFDKKSFNRI